MFIKTILIILLIVVSFILGFAFAPHPALKYDKVTVKGFEYGLEQGSFIIKKESVKVKSVFSPRGMTFLQEPDGTLHLYVKKGMSETLKAMKENQNGRFYAFNVFTYNLFLRVHELRTQVVESILGLFESEPPPEEEETS